MTSEGLLELAPVTERCSLDVFLSLSVLSTEDKALCSHLKSGHSGRRWKGNQPTLWVMVGCWHCHNDHPRFWDSQESPCDKGYPKLGNLGLSCYHPGHTRWAPFRNNIWAQCICVHRKVILLSHPGQICVVEQKSVRGKAFWGACKNFTLQSERQTAVKYHSTQMH